MASRGANCRVVTDFNPSLEAASSYPSCGQYVAVCPSGAILNRGLTVGEVVRDRDCTQSLTNARQNQQWQL